MARNCCADATTRLQGTCGSGSPELKSAGMPAKLPGWCRSTSGGPTNPPVKAMTPPYRAGFLAANSDDRQAPWEKPPIKMRSSETPASIACFTIEPTFANADDSHGSLSSMGARKEGGYQEGWAACGAR